MTIHIQMLQNIAAHARAMADSMQAIVDDCAEQLARRKAAGESEKSIMNDPSTRLPRTVLRPMKVLHPSMRTSEKIATTIQDHDAFVFGYTYDYYDSSLAADVSDNAEAAAPVETEAPADDAAAETTERLRTMRLLKIPNRALTPPLTCIARTFPSTCAWTMRATPSRCIFPAPATTTASICRRISIWITR